MTLTYVDDDVTPSGKIVEKDSKVANSGKRYPVPDPVDPINPITSHVSSCSPSFINIMLANTAICIFIQSEYLYL